jgi:hypothetical protein
VQDKSALSRNIREGRVGSRCLGGTGFRLRFAFRRTKIIPSEADRGAVYESFRNPPVPLPETTIV